MSERNSLTFASDVVGPNKIGFGIYPYKNGTCVFTYPLFTNDTLSSASSTFDISHINAQQYHQLCISLTAYSPTSNTLLSTGFHVSYTQNDGIFFDRYIGEYNTGTFFGKKYYTKFFDGGEKIGLATGGVWKEVGCQLSTEQYERPIGIKASKSDDKVFVTLGHNTGLVYNTPVSVWEYGGGSWTYLTGSTTYTDPRMIINDQNNVFVSWIDSNMSLQVYYYSGGLRHSYSSYSTSLNNPTNAHYISNVDTIYGNDNKLYVAYEHLGSNSLVSVSWTDFIGQNIQTQVMGSHSFTTGTLPQTIQNSIYGNFILSVTRPLDDMPIQVRSYTGGSRQILPDTTLIQSNTGFVKVVALDTLADTSPIIAFATGETPTYLQFSRYNGNAWSPYFSPITESLKFKVPPYDWFKVHNNIGYVAVPYNLNTGYPTNLVIKRRNTGSMSWENLIDANGIGFFDISASDKPQAFRGFDVDSTGQVYLAYGRGSSAAGSSYANSCNGGEATNLRSVRIMKYEIGQKTGTYTTTVSMSETATWGTLYVGQTYDESDGSFIQYNGYKTTSTGACNYAEALFTGIQITTTGGYSIPDIASGEQHLCLHIDFYRGSEDSIPLLDDFIITYRHTDNIFTYETVAIQGIDTLTDTIELINDSFIESSTNDNIVSYELNPFFYCGDTVLSLGETCDDGNTVDGDGCSHACEIETICGNNISEIGEACDDGNTVDGDGCSSVCAIECVDTTRGPSPATVCTTSTLVQTSNCGTTRSISGTKNCSLPTSSSTSSSSSSSTSSSSNGGHGTPTLTADSCPDGDFSHSRYDNTCGEIPTETEDSTKEVNTQKPDTQEQWHGSATESICAEGQPEMRDAYNFSYKYGITSIRDCKSARLDSCVTRKELAKMMSEFAINVLHKEPEAGKAGCADFSDISQESTEYKKYMKLSCELHIMGMMADGDEPKPTFEPNICVRRKHFGTVFSRLHYGDTYNLEDGAAYVPDARYQKHLDALFAAKVMKYVTEDYENSQHIDRPEMEEQRSWVMLVMYRSFKNMTDALDMINP